MKKKKSVSKDLPKLSTIIIVGLICTGLAIAGFFYVESFIPVNTDKLILGVPENHFIKIVSDSDGIPRFAIQSSKVGKVVPGINNSSPEIILSKNALVAFHIINEEKNTRDAKSMHDFHIDEFNVHSDKLEYFQTNTVIFVADKTGVFEYYCSIHPEMKGKILIK